MEQGGFDKYTMDDCPQGVDCPNLRNGTCPNYHAEIYQAISWEIVKRLKKIVCGEDSEPMPDIYVPPQ